MLHLTPHPTGPLLLLSPLLQQAGIPHAFSTRIGGVSTGPFASLNLGNPNGHPIQDPEPNLTENYRRIMSAANLATRTLSRVHQVHGNIIHHLNPGDPAPSGIKADGLFTSCPDYALSVRTADCVPILLASRDGKHVAAVHAGWRGVVAGIVPSAIHLLLDRHTAPADILIAIGPCIGPDHFEVGEEVVDQFRPNFPADIIHRPPGKKPHIDLPRALLHQCLSLQIPASNIDTTDHCTYRDAALFFSHRRDHGLTGRLAAFIATR